MRGLRITQMGYVYRISKRNWRRACRAGSEAPRYGVELEKYGAVLIGPVHANITDWEPEGFAEEFESGV